MYYLIDLERSILSGYTTYWKTNRLGYTKDIKEAGIYGEEVASLIVAEDFDNRTVMVSMDVVKGLGVEVK